MRNALQKHAHRGFGIIGEREPRSERATATAGTPQRRSTDRRESNAKAVARTKGRKASPLHVIGNAVSCVRHSENSRFGTWLRQKLPPHGKRKKRGAHAEETGARRRAQGAQAHPPEPGQITLRPQNVRTDNPTSPKCHGWRAMPTRMRCRRLARSGTSRYRCPHR